MSTIAEAPIIDQTGGVPVVIDPGGDGWAPEPKVTDAERLLYGHYAGIVRLLGQAAVSAEQAYSLTCKLEHEALSSDMKVTEHERVQATWQAYTNLAQTHREVAEAAIAYRRRSHPFVADDGENYKASRDLQVNMGGPVGR